MSGDDVDEGCSETRRHIALIGMAGAGKTTIGRSLASQLGWGFVDLDRAVEADVAMTVSEMFARHGEDAFRHAESEALAAAVGAETPTVISTGGGVVVSETNRRLLSDRARCVWLRSGIRTLVGRLEASRVRRPLLEGDLVASVTRLVGERSDLYEELADVICDVDDRSVRDIVDDLAGRMP